MLVRLNRLEEKNKLVYEIMKRLRKVYISCQNRSLEKAAERRKNGEIDSRYLALKRWKNSHKGERCFILATGPSLNMSDILLLRNEFTIGMNSICLLYKDTDWRADLFGVQDDAIYEKLKDVLHNYPENVIVSQNIYDRFEDSRIFDVFPLNSKYNYYDFRYTDKLHVKFSDDSYATVYDAYSITFSLMQIAIYMGFKEIYLMGCDCNQQVGKKNHFIETGHVEEESKLKTSADRNIYAHQEIKKYCDSIGVKVFNATRGGALEVYPRVKIEDVLNKEVKEF